MISHVRSDDESEDGTQDRHICCDSRKVVNVSLSRPPVGSGATRGARPLPRLGCFACKHLTWIFRSLVSPASAISPVEAELRAEHNHFFVLSPAHSSASVARLCWSPPRLCRLRLVALGFLQLSVTASGEIFTESRARAES